MTAARIVVSDTAGIGLAINALKRGAPPQSQTMNCIRDHGTDCIYTGKTMEIVRHGL
jgi:hypothetical protein